MDGYSAWSGRHTRFLGEVHAGEQLRAKYTVSDKKDDNGYGILAIDYEISKAGKLVVVSRRNLYRIKK